MHQNGLVKLLAPPIKRLPLVATSSVPHTGEFGILSGVCQVNPPSVERLNCLKLHGAAVLHAWYCSPCPMPLVLSILNHCLSPPAAPPSAAHRWETRPRLSASNRAPYVVTKRLEKAEIEEAPCLIRVHHGVAAKHIVFQYTRKCPRGTAIRGKSPAALAEVGRYAVELSPADCHLVAVRWVDGYRRLIRSVANDVVALRVDVDLETHERAIRRDHPRRTLQPKST